MVMDDAAYDRLEALGEARELAGEPNVWDDEYWEGVDFASFRTRDLFNEVADNLYMGGGPWGNPLHLPGYFAAVLDITPSSPFIYWDDTEIRTEIMDDSWHQPLGNVDELARWVNERRKLGPVLVKCAAGLNRSGVVVARALMLNADVLTGKDAVSLIREKRDSMALCNQYFREWIETHV